MWAKFLLIGVGCFVVSIIMLLINKDIVLLIISLFLTAAISFYSVFLYRKIGLGRYITVDGVCTKTEWLPFQRVSRIHLILENGKEQSVFLERRIKPTIGDTYRFYILSEDLRRPYSASDLLAPLAIAAEMIEPAEKEDSGQISSTTDSNMSDVVDGE